MSPINLSRSLKSGSDIEALLTEFGATTAAPVAFRNSAAEIRPPLIMVANLSVLGIRQRVDIRRFLSAFQSAHQSLAHHLLWELETGRYLLGYLPWFQG